jgi:hypothetical protein
MHTPPFGPVYPGAHWQPVSAVVPVTDTAYAWQAVQLVCAVNALYVLYVHVVQSALSCVFLYVPTRHAVHALPSAPVYPTSHLHAVAAELPVPGAFATPPAVCSAAHVKHVPEPVAPSVTEYVSAGQLIQAPVPNTALYFPAAHAVHVLPSDPYQPAGHVQLPSAAVPTTAVVEPDGQFKQTPIPVAATVVEYLPTIQLVHAAEPVPPLYLPATHEVHPQSIGVLETSISWIDIARDDNPAVGGNSTSTYRPVATHATALEDIVSPRSLGEFMPLAQFAFTSGVLLEPTCILMLTFAWSYVQAAFTS